jgi:ubiquinone/menaquinone biosynthesis C-methylase UbiE
MPAAFPSPPTVPDAWARWWNRTRYRLYAPAYDTLAWPMERGRRRAIEWLNPVPDDRILLSGCGTGLDLKYLPTEAPVTAVDAVPAMVRRTKRRARALGRTVDARVGDAHVLPFADDTFDVVVLHLVLSVLTEPEAVLAEAARVVAPGGRVSIYDKFVPEGTAPSMPRRALNPLARLLVSDFNRRLEPMLEETGLRVVSHRDAALWGLYTATIVHPESG